MLDVLPVEVLLEVLRYLPVPSLCSLFTLSHQWYDLLSANQPSIFHNAAILHGYIQPGCLRIEDALAQYTGNPWKGSTDWKDFCKSDSSLTHQEPLLSTPTSDLSFREHVSKFFFSS